MGKQNKKEDSSKEKLEKLEKKLPKIEDPPQEQYYESTDSLGIDPIETCPLQKHKSERAEDNQPPSPSLVKTQSSPNPNILSSSASNLFAPQADDDETLTPPPPPTSNKQDSKASSSIPSNKNYEDNNKKSTRIDDKYEDLNINK